MEVPAGRVYGALEGLREAVGIRLDDANDRKDDDGRWWAMGGVTWGLWRRDPARHQESGRLIMKPEEGSGESESSITGVASVSGGR